MDIEKAVHLRREARKIVKDKEALNILFGEIAPKVKGRNGGYTRIIKTGFRKGDGGETAIIEFVDYDVTEEAKAREKEKEANPGSDSASVFCSDCGLPCGYRADCGGGQRPSWRQ